MSLDATAFSAGETRFFPTPERVAFEPDPAVDLPTGSGGPEPTVLALTDVAAR